MKGDDLFLAALFFAFVIGMILSMVVPYTGDVHSIEHTLSEVYR